MTSPSPPDLFPQRPVRSEFSRVPSYRTRRIITVVVILTIMGGVARWIIGGSVPQQPGEIPTITAEGVWKQKPDRPGGLDIPHQDVQVYQSLNDPDDRKPQVEHLLPPPETPQPAAETAPAKTASAPVPPVLETENLMPKKPDTIDDVMAETLSRSSVTPPPPTQAIAPPPLANPPLATTENTPVAPTPAPAPATPVTSATPIIPAQTDKPAPIASLQAKSKNLTIDQVINGTQTDKMPSTNTGPRRAVQLASVQDEETAHEMAHKLQIKYAAILGSAKLRLVKADLGAKGIYYRIQTQPISETHAGNMCSALKKAKAGCILVRS